jgi:hypothetical protein
MATGAKIVVSIPVHENPPVIRDQIANIQRFLPGAQIVLHVNKNFFFWGDKHISVGIRSEFILRRFVLPSLAKIPGVYVNNERWPTQWGNIFHTHLANFRYAQRELSFDYFLLMSSACMLVQHGAADTIPKTDFGVAARVPTDDWRWRERNEADPIYQAIVQDCGATATYAGQSEGSYYRKELFAEMATVIERHWQYKHDHVRCHEEVYLPTVATTLRGTNSDCPIVIRTNAIDVQGTAAIDVIRNKQWMEHLNPDLDERRKRFRFLTPEAEIFGIRPIPRSVGDPVRRYIRSIAV